MTPRYMLHYWSPHYTSDLYSPLARLIVCPLGQGEFKLDISNFQIFWID